MPAATTDVMDALAGSLDNLALAATRDKTVLQQLMAANLALTTTVADTKGGKEWNKNWYLQGNKDT
jgi:hypothetical protein